MTSTATLMRAVSRPLPLEGPVIVRDLRGYPIAGNPRHATARGALAEKGYQVETNVGIGGYNIDLALRKGDAYVLGIECDGRLYRENRSARERDYHRRKYLESRGWRIHRLWSTNWWKNPAQEIERILRAAEGTL